MHKFILFLLFPVLAFSAETQVGGVKISGTGSISNSGSTSIVSTGSGTEINGTPIVSPTTFATSAQGAKADTAIQPATLATGTAGYAAKLKGVTISQAVGNGTADVTATIQSEIAAMETAGGGCLMIPAGTYKLTDTVRIRKSGVTIKGSGESTKFVGHGDYGHIFDCHPDTEPGGEDQGIVCSGFQDLVIVSSTNRTSGAAIYTHWTRFFRVDGVRIGDMSADAGNPPLMHDGIYMHGQDSMHVSNTRIYMHHWGIFSDGDVRTIVGGLLAFQFDGRVDNNTEIWGPRGYDSGSACVVLGDSNGGVSFTDCNFSWAENGFLVNGSNREVFFGGNVYFDDVGDCGFNNQGYISKFQGVGVWSAGCGRGGGSINAGINLGACEYATISGGRVYANSNGSGIRITSGVLTVTGVQLHGNASDFELGSSVSAAVIVGNVASSIFNPGFSGALVTMGNSGISDTGSSGGGAGGGAAFFGFSGFIGSQTVPGDGEFHLCEVAAGSSPYSYDQTGGAWDNSTSSFTVSETGVYTFSATEIGLSTPSAGDAIQLCIHRAGSPLWTIYDGVIPYQYQTYSSQVDLNLTAGDVIDLRAINKASGDRSFVFVFQGSKK